MWDTVRAASVQYRCLDPIGYQNGLVVVLGRRAYYPHFGFMSTALQRKTGVARFRLGAWRRINLPVECGAQQS